jgi:Protein involved in polysaccharide intercellular adhesin (PIA) synthesis/biofilm formation
MLHSIKQIVGFNVINPANNIDFTLLSISGLLSFGTPAFVMISSILLSRSYPKDLPNNFYKKRINFILLPYIFMAVFYTVVDYYDDITELPRALLYNLIGGYHGWFVIMIFQFYILHSVTIKCLKYISLRVLLVTSAIINLGYLAVFNFTTSPSNNSFVEFFWSRGFWAIFIGWLVYFIFAYYIGTDYEAFLERMRKKKLLIVILLVIATIVIIYDNSLGIFKYGSKRIDMPFFTICLVIILLLAFSRYKNIPPMIELINRYSFGIYLLHIFYLNFITKICEYIHIELNYWLIPVLFIAVIPLSIYTMKIINISRYGEYIIGKSGGDKRQNKLFIQKTVQNRN